MKPFVLVAAIAFAGAVYAADASAPQAGDQKPMHNGMMGKGMMGNGMMGACQSMMDGGGAGMAMRMGTAPKFPPGNEKLEAQMHAEMMQKMGEIAARYAERIKERP
ncbi:hypothetical protein HQN59_22205 [Schlegelella sp. ID0723]|uniref:Uncharacterized protein n=1 Tax=Piscinibacter koreensis TaxID=2742824 RepID=A0A7Y6NSP3_9BURK|nr:hypothetical protein [Schlegelella koreensis]